MGKAWKEFEDRICIALGGRRVLGNRGSGVPDSDENVPFAVEAKHGYEQYRLPSKWLEQAKKNAKASGKPWLIVQAPKHSRAPIATLDFFTFAQIAARAGMLHPSLTDAPLLERFWSKVDRSGECWIWTAGCSSKGYGIFSIDRHPFGAHRVVWMLTRGVIPKGMSVLHKCDNPPCVNPEHLYLGTALENNRDRLERGRNPQKNKTECKRGHAYTPENTRLRPNGSRCCRTCEREGLAKKEKAGMLPEIVVEDDAA